MPHAVLLAGRMLLALGFGFSSFLQAQESGASAVGPSIPFELHSDFLVVVTRQVGDLHGWKFILDTVASDSVIDQKVADRLKLQRRPGKITNFTSDVPVKLAEIPNLRVGPLQARASVPIFSSSHPTKIEICVAPLPSTIDSFPLVDNSPLSTAS